MSLYPWLIPTWQGLQSAMRSDRLPGAILLQADDELGIEQLIEQFSSALLCKTYPAEGCGFCHSCELLKSQSHPDLHLLHPEKQGKAITVEQIRQCNRKAQESSQMGGYRLFVIEPAEAMNESASNALLKTLEEPTNRCLFLLVSRNKQQLLPTIVSRCQQWVIPSPTTEVSLAWLDEQSIAIDRAFLKLAHNSPITAKRMVDSLEFEQYQQLERAFCECLSSPDGDIASLCALIQTDTLRNLSWLWLLLSDAQKVHFALNNEELLPGCRAISHLPLAFLQAAMTKLNTLIKQLRSFSGLNEELMLMNWIIEIRETLCS